MAADDHRKAVDNNQLLVHVIGGRTVGDVNAGIGQHVSRDPISVVTNRIIIFRVILRPQIQHDLHIDPPPMRSNQVIDKQKYRAGLSSIPRNPHLKHRYRDGIPGRLQRATHRTDIVRAANILNPSLNPRPRRSRGHKQCRYGKYGQDPSHDCHLCLVDIRLLLLP